MVNYDDIYRNIANTQIQGDVITITWKCPISEKNIATSNARMTAKKDLSGNLQKELVTGAVRQAKYWFASMAGRLLGHAVSDTIRRMGTHLEKSAAQAQKYGVEEQKEAIVRAWEKVKDKFEYSRECLVYVAREETAAGSPPPIPGAPGTPGV